MLDDSWSTDRITPEGREKLRAAGFAPPAPREAAAPTARAAAERAFRCPYCGSTETRLENLFGPTPCRSLRYCDELPAAVRAVQDDLAFGDARSSCSAASILDRATGSPWPTCAGFSLVGASGVRTYLQSGNVVLSSSAKPDEVARKCEQLIEEAFGLDIAVVTRTRQQLAQVVKRNPLGKVAKNPKRYQVSFLTTKAPDELGPSIRVRRRRTRTTHGRRPRRSHSRVRASAASCLPASNSCPTSLPRPARAMRPALDPANQAGSTRA